MFASQEGSRRREELVYQCTRPEFNNSISRRVGQALQPIIAGEAEVLQEKPELYVLPSDASPDVPDTLEGYVREAIDKEWAEVCQRFQNPYRFTVITADSRKQTHTWMKFDTCLPLLEAECATLHCLEIDSVHLPLRIGVNRGEAIILPKDDGISEDLFVELVAVLSRAFADERVDAMSDDELKASIARTHSFTTGQEVLPLNLLLNAPDQFCRLIDGRDFSVSPHRLMTEEESTAWLQMAAEVVQVNRRGQDVVVGEKGYGSYQIVRGEVNFGTGLTLHRNFLNSDGAESSIQTTEFLTPIRAGQKVLGTTVCKLTAIPTFGELRAGFDHAGSELHYFNQWRSRQEAEDAAR